MAIVDRFLREQATAAPTTELDVIVTVEPGVDNDRLTAAGLVVVHRVERINAVSGTIQAGKLDGLAALSGVVRIEADSPMRTF